MMTAEAATLHRALRRLRLPPGWTCEEAWPWKTGTHLIAPARKGGVIVKHRRVTVQLPGTGPGRPTVNVHDGGRTFAFHGRDWQKRIVAAARLAVRAWGRLCREWEPPGATRFVNVDELNTRRRGRVRST